MLLCLIGLFLFIVGLVFHIFYEKGIFVDSNVSLIISSVGKIFGGVISLVCIGLIIVNNSSIGKEIKIAEINSQIECFNSNYEVLSNYTGETPKLISFEVSEYNKEIKNFKFMIQEAQINKKNIWINWMVSPVYNEYTGDEVQYIK